MRCEVLEVPKRDQRFVLETSGVEVEMLESRYFGQLGESNASDRFLLKTGFPKHEAAERLELGEVDCRRVHDQWAVFEMEGL